MSVLAERYALALFQASKKKDQLVTVNSFLAELATALSDHADIRQLFFSPMVSAGDKLALLKTSVGGQFPPELESFFTVLSENNRLGILPEIARAFTDLINQDKGLMNGTVVSAVDLSDDEKKSLQQTIEKELETSVTLTFSVDPQVIGGVEVKVGSYVFEDSVLSHMEKLNDFITRRVQ